MTGEADDDPTEQASAPTALLSSAQRETLGLLCVLGVGAYLFTGAVGAYRFAQPDVPSQEPFNPIGSHSLGVDWGRALRFAALYANVMLLPLLVLALVLVLGRRWSEMGRAGRVALWALFVVGIVAAADAGYAALLSLSASVDGAIAPIGGSDGSQPVLDRIAAASTYLVMAVGSMFVAWLAFGRLPIANAGAKPDDDPSA